MYEIFTPPTSESRILDYRLATFDWKRFIFVLGSSLLCVFTLLLISYQWIIRRPIPIPASTEVMVVVRPQQSALLSSLSLQIPDAWTAALRTSSHFSVILGRYKDNGDLLSFAIIPRWRSTPMGLSYRENHGLFSFVSERSPNELQDTVTIRQTHQWLSLAKQSQIGFSLQPSFISDALTGEAPIHGAIAKDQLIQTDLAFHTNQPVSGDGDWAYAPTASPWNKTLLQQISFGRLPLSLLPDQPSEIVQWQNGSSTAIEVRFAQEPSALTMGLLGTGANLFKKSVRPLVDGSQAVIETPLPIDQLPTSTKTSVGIFTRTTTSVSLRSDDTPRAETKKEACPGLLPAFFFTQGQQVTFFGSRDGRLAICRVNSISASVDK